MIKSLAVLVLFGVAFADQIPTLVATAARNIRGASSIKGIPYHVGILYEGSVHCGGIILSEEWILTAASCVNGSNSLLSVRAGTSNSTHGGSIHNISRIILHENFGDASVSGYTTHNIALIRLATPLTIDATRRPIELYESGEKTSERTTGSISGYGKFALIPQSSYFLLTQAVTIISEARCKSFYRREYEEPSQLCAEYFPNEGQDLCQYDAGAALTVYRRVAGITIKGMGCLRTNGRIPIIYTDVGFFRDWIKEHCGL